MAQTCPDIVTYEYDSRPKNVKLTNKKTNVLCACILLACNGEHYSPVWAGSSPGGAGDLKRKTEEKLEHSIDKLITKLSN